MTHKHTPKCPTRSAVTAHDSHVEPALLVVGWMDQGANLGGFAMFIGGGVAGCGLAIAQWIAGGNNFVGACQLPSRPYQLTLYTVYLRHDFSIKVRDIGSAGSAMPVGPFAAHTHWSGHGRRWCDGEHRLHRQRCLHDPRPCRVRAVRRR